MDERVLEFYYYGFYSALKRFRGVVAVGWFVTCAGAGAFVVRFEAVRSAGLFDIIVCLGCVVAGIAVVQTAVAALTAYVRVPFPVPEPSTGEQEEIVGRLRDLMKNVEDGGWREAREAIHAVRELGVRYGLPFPDRPLGPQR
jgi:hypothetical protein